MQTRREFPRNSFAKSVYKNPNLNRNDKTNKNIFVIFIFFYFMQLVLFLDNQKGEKCLLVSLKSFSFFLFKGVDLLLEKQ